MIMSILVDIKKEIWEEKRKYFENYPYYCRKIKESAEKVLGPVRVLVFGSIVRGDWTPNSDIDVLIISDKLSKNWEENAIYKVNIKRDSGIGFPFQIHLVRPEEFESWYKNFIKNDYIEIE